MTECKQVINVDFIMFSLHFAVIVFLVFFMEKMLNSFFFEQTVANEMVDEWHQCLTGHEPRHASLISAVSLLAEEEKEVKKTSDRKYVITLQSVSKLISGWNQSAVKYSSVVRSVAVENQIEMGKNCGINTRPEKYWILLVGAVLLRLVISAPAAGGGAAPLKFHRTCWKFCRLMPTWGSPAPCDADLSLKTSH